jgi:hypothetical protein
MADDPANFDAYRAWRNSAAGKAAKEGMSGGTVAVCLGATLAAAGVGYPLWHLLSIRSGPTEGRGR